MKCKKLKKKTMIALGTFFADSDSVHTYPVNPAYESATLLTRLLIHHFAVLSAWWVTRTRKTIRRPRMGESLRYVNSFCLILWSRIALQKKRLGKFQRQRDNLNPSKVHGRASENSWLRFLKLIQVELQLRKRNWVWATSLGRKIL